MENEAQPNFETIKGRLDEIVEEVSDEGISLDDALELFEEAVGLGMKVSSLLEEGIEESQIAEPPEETPPVAAPGEAPSGNGDDKLD